VFELEEQHWGIKIQCIKAHAGHRGNEVADQLAKEAAAGKQTEIYNKTQKYDNQGTKGGQFGKVAK
jgi:ribonuclease HI